MAELGVAASAISIASIAIQVGDSIIKLKDFWNHVKEAPEEIKWLMEEIETLGFVLSGVESSKAHSDPLHLEPAFANRCLESCRKGASILEAVVKEADEEIRKRRKVGGVKAVLKKGTIERLKERLRSAQLMLMLSNQAYSERRALQKQRHELHREWAELQQRQLDELRTSVSQSTDVVLSLHTTVGQQASLASPSLCNSRPSHAATASDSLERTDASVQKAQKRQQTFLARLGGPRWLPLIGRVLEVSGSRAPCGWNFSIRTYNVVSRHSPAMQFAARGKLSELQKLITEGKASLLDRDEYGRTLLSIAVANQRLEIVKFIIGQGFDDTGHPSIFFTGITRWERKISNEDIMELLRLIVPITDFDYLDHHRKIDSLTLTFVGEVDLFAWILRQSGCSFRNLSISERVDCCTNLLFHNDAWVGLNQPDAAGLVRLVFENMKLDPTVCKTTDNIGRSLIHAIARDFSCVTEGQLVSDLHRNEFSTVYDLPHYSSELLSLLQDVIRANSNLHGLAFQQLPAYLGIGGAHLRTPLLMAFSGVFWNASELARACGLIKVARLTMIAWIEQLQTMGIDLLEYGRKEKELHIQEKVAKEYFGHYLCRSICPKIRLISFTYGPEPADWHFWFTEVMENYFIQFWDMVDHPERAMPGAWIEDDEDFVFDLYKPYDSEYDSPPTIEDCDRWKPSDEPWRDFFF
ncbi:hypothetical protein LSUB1_G008307 [Lachnellula subtilissima]|uniref:Fungal N-terminal domain-containing protein n=1 Tax=Lachnellula subtilissima TaxID=602034 RepID=A0A8H8RBK7_9HELO|nr:hypothetical protein LSUB1_G008307 [Lachnellula subtilissima]